MKHGFTLIELLVVVAIMALLISILLPSLSQARAQAKAVKCGAMTKHIALAMQTYVSEFDAYPPSYLYPSSPGSTSLVAQSPTKEYGYLHWSHFLYSSGRVDNDAFQCPDYPKGGAPRTNPGPNPGDWNPGQADDRGQTGSGTVRDDQAPRMAYMANAVIVPRNKFTTLLAQQSGGNGQRLNKLVKSGNVKKPSQTILAAEFSNNWEAISVAQGGGKLVKSHRPINPFYSVGAGYNELRANPSQTVPFRYKEILSGDERNLKTFGLLNRAEYNQRASLIESPGINPANVVGRHHPGGDREFGGTANFAYCDGHVERKTVLQTLQAREWGIRFFSLTGTNDIRR